LTRARRGRPPETRRTRLDHRADLVQDLSLAAIDGWARFPGGPTLEWVAGRVGYTPRALRRRLQRIGMPWSELKNWAKSVTDVKFTPVTL
jgi:hypothetical protein